MSKENLLLLTDSTNWLREYIYINNLRHTQHFITQLLAIEQKT